MLSHLKPLTVNMFFAFYIESYDYKLEKENNSCVKSIVLMLLNSVILKCYMTKGEDYGHPKILLIGELSPSQQERLSLRKKYKNTLKYFYS